MLSSHRSNETTGQKNTTSIATRKQNEKSNNSDKSDKSDKSNNSDKSDLTNSNTNNIVDKSPYHP